MKEYQRTRSVIVLLVLGLAYSKADLMQIGCFTDSGSRVLPELVYKGDELTLELCQEECRSKGYAYYGAEYSKECFCGQGPYDVLGSSGFCNMACSGNSSQICGGGWALSVGATGLTHYPSEFPTTEPTNSPTITVSPTNSPSIGPTSTPSDSPTFSPTASPTSAPTLLPSMAPTQNPTLFPCLDLVEPRFAFSDGTPAECKDLARVCGKYQLIQYRCPITCGFDCSQRPPGWLPEPMESIQLLEDPPKESSNTTVIIAAGSSIGLISVALFGVVLYRRKRLNSPLPDEYHEDVVVLEVSGPQFSRPDFNFKTVNPMYKPDGGNV